MYDGLYYSIYYKTSKNKEYNIFYIPDQLPDSLKLLHNYVVNTLLNKPLTPIMKFSFNNITVKTAYELFKTSPPPPPAQLIEQRVKSK
jgi:hypothetical protein